MNINESLNVYRVETVKPKPGVSGHFDFSRSILGFRNRHCSLVCSRIIRLRENTFPVNIRDKGWNRSAGHE
jgi:hypothetical protein